MFIPIGGRWDYIGVAWGTDDQRIVEIRHAIRSFGTFEATFIKARFTLANYAAFAEAVTALRKAAG